MKKNTKQDLIDKAETLFAQHGFYGTSIQEIAATLNISKQALLHHFASKEKLYAAVLSGAADTLMKDFQAYKAQYTNPVDCLAAVILGLFYSDAKRQQVCALLMRELMDNPTRASKAQQWFLKDWLDGLVGLIERAQQQGHYPQQQPLALLFHWLGAAQYVVIARPTLQQLYGEETLMSMLSATQQQLNAQLRENVA